MTNNLIHNTDFFMKNRPPPPPPPSPIRFNILEEIIIRKHVIYSNIIYFLIVPLMASKQIGQSHITEVNAKHGMIFLKQHNINHNLRIHYPLTNVQIDFK